MVGKWLFAKWRLYSEGLWFVASGAGLWVIGFTWNQDVLVFAAELENPAFFTILIPLLYITVTLLVGAIMTAIGAIKWAVAKRYGVQAASVVADANPNP